MAEIKNQPARFRVLFIIFGIMSLVLMLYYLSNTLIHFTSGRQFPINSFSRFPLSILIFPAEIFSFIFAMYLVFTLSTGDYKVDKRPVPKDLRVPVAILYPVLDEPESIMERTLSACRKMNWHSRVVIYILEDSKTGKYGNTALKLAKKYGALLIRREGNAGFKAGNINNAVKNHLKEDFFVILDADQAPRPDFLIRCMASFSDKSVGFVQAPQHFINDSTPLERAAKIGTNIFYRAQCPSKASDGAVPFCGTNVIVRKSSFLAVGGYSYYMATEDIDIGLRMNALGYRGAYIPEILVDGYAPNNFKAYSSQQYRWSNGNLAILRENWLKLLKGNFSFRYTVHMFFTLAWWMIGLVTLAYIIVPIISVIFRLGTHHTWLPSFFLLFLFLHVVVGISMIYATLKGRVDGDDVRFSDALLEYSLITNSMFIYSRAAINALVFRKYIGFVKTNKSRESSSLGLVKWNLILGGVCFVMSAVTLYFGMLSVDSQQFRTYLPVSLWLLFYSLILLSSIIFVSKEGEIKQ
jgi:cellulose synthase (UDP-forming)